MYEPSLRLALEALLQLTDSGLEESNDIHVHRSSIAGNRYRHLSELRTRTSCHDTTRYLPGFLANLIRPHGHMVDQGRTLCVRWFAARHEPTCATLVPRDTNCDQTILYVARTCNTGPVPLLVIEAVLVSERGKRSYVQCC